MSDIEKQIGARITELRLSRKLTQAQLAEKANLSVETISRMERGASFPSLKTLENIEEAIRGRSESAGINRHRVGDERALHERSS